MHAPVCVCVWMGLLCFGSDHVCVAETNPEIEHDPLGNYGIGIGIAVDDRRFTIWHSNSCVQWFWCKNLYDGKDAAQSKWD